MPWPFRFIVASTAVHLANTIGGSAMLPASRRCRPGGTRPGASHRRRAEEIELMSLRSRGRRLEAAARCWAPRSSTCSRQRRFELAPARRKPVVCAVRPPEDGDGRRQHHQSASSRRERRDTAARQPDRDRPGGEDRRERDRHASGDDAVAREEDAAPCQHPDRERRPGRADRRQHRQRDARPRRQRRLGQPERAGDRRSWPATPATGSRSRNGKRLDSSASTR